IELDREVQRILAAAVADLIEILLDDTELVRDVICRRDDVRGLGVHEALGNRALEASDAQHRVVRRRQLVANLHCEGELLPEIGDGNTLEPWIHSQDERLRLRLVRGGDADAVRPWHGEWALFRARTPENQAG